MIATALDATEGYSSWLQPYVDRLPQGDYVALMLSHRPNGYRFDRGEFMKIKDMPWVVFDFREYGWESSWKNRDLLGADRQEQPMYSGPEWDALNFHACFPEIVAYFKRELTPQIRLSTAPFPIYPIDLISHNRPWFGPVTKDDYMDRRGQVMHVWGHSHEDRVLLNERITEIKDDQFYAEEVHHSMRFSLKQVLSVQSTFPLSCALPGCGVKTFRHSESGVNCVPVVADCGMEFSVPWTQDNAVLLPTVEGRINPGQSVQIIKDALQDKEALWGKYQRAQLSSKLLDQDIYVSTFVNPHILSAL